MVRAAPAEFPQAGNGARVGGRSARYSSAPFFMPIPKHLKDKN